FNNLDVSQKQASILFSKYTALDGADSVVLPNTSTIVPGGWIPSNQFDAGGGNDTIAGGDRRDAVFGGAGDDVLTGGIGNDTMLGGLGNDVLNGGSDGDVLEGGSGADTINGGDGFDVASWLGESSGLVLNLSDQALNGGSGAGDSISNIEA